MFLEDSAANQRSLKWEPGWYAQEIAMKRPGWLEVMIKCKAARIEIREAQAAGLETGYAEDDRF